MPLLSLRDISPIMGEKKRDRGMAPFVIPAQAGDRRKSWKLISMPCSVMAEREEMMGM
ncbi:MAG TPA: hypothetical protein PK906_17480 [Spirochaetota bacterium]|nr:hypothetical protein [Spirochaetota bacterium]